MPLSAGDKLGPYEILSPGIGEVYLGNTRLGGPVAIRVSARVFNDRFPSQILSTLVLEYARSLSDRGSASAGAFGDAGRRHLAFRSSTAPVHLYPFVRPPCALGRGVFRRALGQVDAARFRGNVTIPVSVLLRQLAEVVLRFIAWAHHFGLVYQDVWQIRFRLGKCCLPCHPRNALLQRQSTL